MSTAVETVDVVIVGARCAGTAAAVPLARAGRRVVVLEKGRFPSDTLSTHILVPNGVQELRALGALDRILALGPSRSRYLTITDGDLEIRERFRPFSGIDYALCILRDQQDVALVEAAREAGAEIRERTNVAPRSCGGTGGQPATERPGWSVGEPHSPPSYRPAAVVEPTPTRDVGTDPLPA